MQMMCTYEEKIKSKGKNEKTINNFSWGNHCKNSGTKKKKGWYAKVTFYQMSLHVLFYLIPRATLHPPDMLILILWMI